MPDDAVFDQRLRRAAQAALDAHAATVDVDAEFDALRTRLVEQPGDAALVRVRPNRARWLAAAAAALIVVGGLVAIAWPRGGDRTAIVAPPPDSDVDVTSAQAPDVSTAPSTTEPATGASGPQAAAAIARPDVVTAGEVVTITPAGTIERMCLDIVTLIRLEGTDAGGQIIDGEWLAAPDGDVTAVTYPACQGATSDSALSLVIPADVPTGDYEMCLTEPGNPNGCARVTVQPPNSGEPPADQAAVELDVGYFGRRVVDAPPYFEVDQFGADGSPVATLTDDEVELLYPRFTLPDGSAVTLEGGRDSARCGNRPLTRDSGGQLHPALGEARSIGVTSTGVVIAGRDVCPTGTRWGDPGTRWELVALDPAAPASEPEILLTRESDSSQVQFDDGQVVIAMGEMLVEDISPDGRYVALRDVFHTEKSKWHVLDLETPGQVLPIESTCELAGDIVGPPRFAGDGIVVVARLCADLHIDNGSPYVGSGDVQVEAIDLTATAPSERIVWHGSAPGLGADSYSRTVELSVRRDDDGAVWALLSGGGGVEVPSRTFALRGDSAIEITRVGYWSFAFDPADLISPWDELPA